jgi:Protein involved in formate dehydrogenase formation
MADAPRSPQRPEPRELAELRALRTAQPQLAPAIDLQIELIELLRRLRARVPTPTAPLGPEATRARLSGGRRLLELPEISLDWSELRLAIRQTADLLRRHDALDTADHGPIVALARESDTLLTLVTAWYAETGVPPADRADLAAHRRQLPEALDQVLSVAIRPFLARAAEAAAPDAPVADWGHPWCPFCGSEPEFAAVIADDVRVLTCGRCEGRWPWLFLGCPWCETRDASRLVTLASPDRKYRVYGCNECHRYLKGYDARGGRRPVLPAVDTIATLPLDAAAMQRGFAG